jgi:4'-phosphopantetheinyl transferase
VIAVAWQREIGVDVERLRPERDLEGVARYSFSAREQRDLASLTGPAWTAGFYHCWTQKEAFIKLVGAGLSFPLDGFDVQVHADKPPALLAIRTPAPNALPCRMDRIPVPPGYAGAIAVRGVASPIRAFSVD